MKVLSIPKHAELWDNIIEYCLQNNYHVFLHVSYSSQLSVTVNAVAGVYDINIPKELISLFFAARK